MTHLSAETVLISRNGAVKIRTKRAFDAVLGWVGRDPQNPRRWLALNFRGLPVGRHASTRAEAFDQLTHYTETVVLSPIPAEEHASEFEGSVDFVSELVPERQAHPWKVIGEWTGIIVGGALAVLTSSLAIWGLVVLSTPLHHGF